MFKDMTTWSTLEKTENCFMFRDMTGNTKFARCEGCGEPIFDRWDLLASMSSAIKIFLIVSQTISNQLDQVCDAAVRQFLARGLSLLFTGLPSLPLSSFGGSSTVALSQKSIPGQGHVILGVKEIYTFYEILNLSVKKSKTRPDIFTLIYSWAWHILKITRKRLHIPSYDLLSVSSVKFETFPGKANFLPQHSEYI